MKMCFFATEKPVDVAKGRTSGEKRSTVQLKRSSKASDKSKKIGIFVTFQAVHYFVEYFQTDAEAKSLQSTIVGSTTNEKRASPSCDSAAASAAAASAAAAAAAKKPIHLRLGAMTKTWKTSKKTWRTEKVLSITV